MRRPSAFPRISEDFLRHLWQERKFTSSGLKTSDGRPIEILSPGTPNLDGGPDYRNAAIRIGRITYRGDVELHIDARSWETHRHHHDPHYNSVILHVVLTAKEHLSSSQTASRRLLPLLILHPYLDPVTEQDWLAAYRDEKVARQRILPCAGRRDAVPPEVIEHWLLNLSRQRLELKIQRMEVRLKQLVDEARGIVREPYPRYCGNLKDIPPAHPGFAARDFSSRLLWDQLLYEGLMEGMGYSKNRATFLSLARSIRISLLRGHGLHNTQTMMALLFGAAGLLPSTRQIKERESRSYLRPLRRTWREVRPLLRRPLLQEGDWLFFRLRPVNFPTARLACFCFLLPKIFRDEALRELIALFTQPLRSGEVLASLHGRFAFEPDRYWRRHCHFRGSGATAGIALGSDRVNALIINAILPLILLYARLFRKPPIREQALRVMQIIPPSGRNSITMTMEDQLLHDRLHLRTAAHQQGIIQLYQAYCLAHRCEECAVGIWLQAKG